MNRIDKIVEALQTKGSVYQKMTMIIIAILIFVYLSLRLINNENIITALIMVTLIIVIIIISWLIDLAIKYPQNSILEGDQLVTVTLKKMVLEAKNSGTLPDIQKAQIDDNQNNGEKITTKGEDKSPKDKLEDVPQDELEEETTDNSEFIVGEKKEEDFEADTK